MSTSDEFRVDDRGFTADGYSRLVSDSKKSMYLKSGVWIAAETVIVSAVIVSSGVSGYPYLAILGALAALIAYHLVFPQVYYRRYRYRITDDQVDIRMGVVFIRHTLVPIERIHQVDVTSGPFSRIFGLADVDMTTAGGTASISYLERPVAEGIAHRLNEVVVKILKGRE